MMTRAQAVAIATAVQQVRPEWDHPGILAALHAAQGMGSPAEVAAAAFRLAGNLQVRTPGMLAQPGAHWKAPAEGGPTVSVVVTRCPEHPEHPAARCPACDSRRGEVDHDAGVAAVREALRSAPRYEPPAVKAARAAERRGA
jgi:hypothetical protein